MKRRSRRPSVESLEPRLCLANVPPAFPGTPLNLPVLGPETNSSFRSSPVMADLNGDGRDELIVSVSGGQLVAFSTDANGNLKVFQTYNTGAATTTQANIKATPVVVFDPFIGHDAIFAALGRDENTPGHIEDGRVFGFDALTGQILPGWPQDTGGTFIQGFQSGVTGPLASGDLDGDGIPEIVVTSFSQTVNAYHLNGSLMWRTENDDTVESGVAIGDLNHDGNMEVVYASSEGPNSFFPAGGVVDILDGKTGEFEYRTGAASSIPSQRIPEEFFAAPTLVDLFGDGRLEIVVGPGPHFNNPAQGGFSPAAQAAGDRIYAFDQHGILLPGWPFHTTTDDTLDRQTFVSVAAADLLGNGQNEVIAEDRAGFLHVIMANGQPLPGWETPKPIAPDTFPDTVASTAFFTPVVADVDGDGKADIVGGRNAFVAAYDRNGNLLWRTTTPTTAGRPVADTTFGSAAVGQLDGKGGLELAYVSFAGGAPFDTPSHLNILQLPASTLAPPWPMHRQTPQGASAANSLPFEATFTNKMYQALLGRAPTAGELVAIATALDKNTFTPQAVAASLASSTEARGHVADVCYRRYLNRAPTPGERASAAFALGSETDRALALQLVNLPEFSRRANGSVPALIGLLFQTILGRPASQADINNAIAVLSTRVLTYSQYANALLGSDEATARDAAPIYQAITGSPTISPESLTALAIDLRNGRREESAYATVVASLGNYAATNGLAQYVRTVYRDAIGRDPSQAESAAAISFLNSGKISRTDLAEFLLNGKEGRDNFIREQFERILGRDPTPGEVGLQEGFATRQSLTTALLSSDEFFRNVGGTLPAFIQGAFTKITYADVLDSNTINFWIGQINQHGGNRGYLANLLVINEAADELVFHYLPDLTQGVLRTGTQDPNGPGQPINPPPVLVSAANAALNAGAREEDVIANLMANPLYVARAVYEEGLYRSRGIRN